jgi:glutathione S-transferase
MRGIIRPTPPHRNREHIHMYTLYGRKGSGSFVVEAMLAETGQPCKFIDASPTADGKPHAGLLKLNPLGQVPTLVLPDKTVMTESAAMVIYLGDRHAKAGLAPARKSKQRAAYLRWLTFMSANIYPSDLRLYYAERYSIDPNAAAGIKAAAVSALEREWAILAKALGKGPWLLGRKFSAADIYAAMLSTWNPDLPAFYAKHPNVKALCDRVKARKKIGPIWEANGMP